MRSGFVALRADPEFARLLAASARLGADPLHIQAAGGNTSLKRGGGMLVKASGTWLSESLERDIMVPVAIDGLVAGLDTLEEAELAGFVSSPDNPSGLRPSMETAVHAVIPWPVVIHTHSVAALSVLIRSDAAALVAERLGDLGAVFVPYATPGLPLARSIAACRRHDVRLLLLGNHGVITAGETVEEAVDLLETALDRLEPSVPELPVASGALSDVLMGSAYQPAEGAHALALDPQLTQRAAAGCFYPDHVVFLGPFVEVTDDPRAARAPLVLLPGLGAAIRADLGPGPRALAACLADVLARVPREAELAPLSPAAVAALLDLDAEKYRQALERGEGTA